MFVTVMRVVMVVVVLVRIRSLIVAVFVSVLNTRALWSRTRGMRMLMLRIVAEVRVGMYDSSRV
jgi:hypothetical protein